MTILNGWHPGEREIQKRVNIADSVAVAYTWIDEYMPEQHRVFHSQNIPFLPLTILDDLGRPWGSILAGAYGEPGFIASPNETKLVLDVKLWPGDPIVQVLDTSNVENVNLLAAGIGIELSTRRRNKLAGRIDRVERTGKLERRLHLDVNQAIGNCPKYINVRELVPHPGTQPVVVLNEPRLVPEVRLPDNLISFITASDTVFMGSSYHASPADEGRFPSHVGMNHRGGRPGFIRVKPSDGRTVVLPDYSGNRLMTSLGNIEATSLASMTFIDFVSGDILYLTGKAQNLVGAEAQELMPLQNVLTTMYITGYAFVRKAFPLRQRSGTRAARSPYSPPIRYLAEERPSDNHIADIFATLAKIEILSATLVRFTFETSAPVHISPGQAAILDFRDLLGTPQYAHMAPGAEASVNDDRVRTWTVSSAHPREGTREFALTMREKAGGLVTGALFAIARQAAARMPAVLRDARPLRMRVGLLGISGEFTLRKGRQKLLWIAGGIGVTPFLSMLTSLRRLEEERAYDIAFILSTREPDVLLPLVHDVLGEDKGEQPPNLTISLQVFTEGNAPDLQFPPNVSLSISRGRVDLSTIERLGADIVNRVVYLCGPPSFEETVLSALSRTGVDTSHVIREGFSY